MARSSGKGSKGSTLTAHKVDRVVNAPRENGEESDNSSDKDESKPEPVKSESKKETIPEKKTEVTPVKESQNQKSQRLRTPSARGQRPGDLQF